MKRVLLAEDNDNLREVVSDYLEDKGYNITAVRDGALAWETFQEHISDLISQMLTYTRVSDSHYKFEKKELVMNDIVKSVSDRFEVLIENKNINFEFNQPGRFEIQGDEKMLEMVIDNLISNAVRHCSENKKISITVDNTIIRVYNDGQRIAPDEMRKIWEPLYKSNKSRTDGEGVSGMGLAISAKILDAHGLKYGVENKPNGVEFVILKMNNHK